MASDTATTSMDGTNLQGKLSTLEDKLKEIQANLERMAPMPLQSNQDRDVAMRVSGCFDTVHRCQDLAQRLSERVAVLADQVGTL